MRHCHVLAVLISTTLLLAGCAQDGPVESQAAPVATSSPSPEIDMEGEPTPDVPAENSLAEEESSAGARVPGQSERHEPQRGPAVNVPALGRYTYELSRDSGSGETQTDTFDVVYREHKPIPSGVEVIFQLDGSDRSDGPITAMWWEDSRILLVREASGPSSECNYRQPDGTPGLIMAKFPLQAQTYPQQVWQSDSCSGSLESAVERRETVETAGRTWDAWRVRYKKVLRQQMGPPLQESFEMTTEGTRWFSPELGVDLRDEATVRVKMQGRTQSTKTLQNLIHHP